MLNGQALPPTAFDGGRIRLGGLAAENKLEVLAIARYMRDGTGLHRFQDPVDGRFYLHSQFESNDAHRVYACFDQPDLKATFELTVVAPEDWLVVSNTTAASRDGGVWVFPPTPRISTYITAIVTGHYAEWHDQHEGIPLGLYCRQSLAQYFDHEEIFEVTKQGLDFFARTFDYPYPFAKYDQLFVPEFSAGAMENAACVTHSERMVPRSKVTDAAKLSRAETILHEMAHMWFGDLVTMKWFNDLWLNESFATYMAYVSMVGGTRFKSAWLDFATREKARAMAQDQLPTTHPIVADIPDVDSVHLNFDAITYEKGASVLKQLVAWVGEEAFFKGVQKYFRTHEYGNTELPDFLAPLELASGRDLTTWSKLWLETAGVNTIEPALELDGDKIRSAALKQTAPADHPTLRPHRLSLGLYELKGKELKKHKAISLDVDGPLTAVPELAGETMPDLLLPNDDDNAYTKLHLDQRSVDTLAAHLKDLREPLARAVAWAALWDMVRDARMRARRYLDVVLANIDVETEPLMTQALINLMSSAIDTYGDPENRGAARELIAAGARARAQSATPGSDRQLLWVRALIDSARNPKDVTWVRGLLDGSTRLDGLKVDFAIRWAAVVALARTATIGADEIAAELDRDPTEEGRRAAATARAVRPLPEAKEEAWSATTNGSDVSLAMKLAFAAGFQRVDQEGLIEPYVRRFFDELIATWDSHDIDEGLMFVRGMFPSTIVRPDVIEFVEEELSRELPGPVRRSLLESQDDLARALSARLFDASGGA